MTILRLILMRLFSASLTLFLVSSVVFFLVDALPGDAATRVLGRAADAASLEVLREQLNLNAPILERYWLWFTGFIQGDFGHSLISKRPVMDILWPKISNTLVLSAVALALYLPVSAGIAFIQATMRGTRVDQGLSYVVLTFLSIPDFLLATFLLILFGVLFQVFPTSSTVDGVMPLSEWIQILAMPAITLTILMSVYAIRMLRDNLIEVLEADYIRLARFKGLRSLHILWRHALPNALSPTLNITALNIGYLVGGVVVVEKVFGYPGFGSQTIDSLQLRDVPMIQATVIISAMVYILSNLVADVVSILANPRLR